MDQPMQQTKSTLAKLLNQSVSKHYHICQLVYISQPADTCQLVYTSQPADTCQLVYTSQPAASSQQVYTSQPADSIIFYAFLKYFSNTLAQLILPYYYCQIFVFLFHFFQIRLLKHTVLWQPKVVTLLYLPFYKETKIWQAYHS